MARCKCSHCWVRVQITSCWDRTWDQVWRAHDTSLQTPPLCLLEPKMPAEMVSERNRECTSQCKSNTITEGSGTFFTYLTRWDILRHSFQYSDVVTFDVQNTKNWAAFTDQRFPPILMVGKLLPLQANKEHNSRVNRNLKIFSDLREFFVPNQTLNYKLAISNTTKPSQI